MADAVGKKSLLCVPVESHKRIRRLLSEPFSMTSLSAFITKFDKLLCGRLQGGKSFKVLDFCMKVKTLCFPLVLLRIIIDNDNEMYILIFFLSTQMLAFI
jgi:hypothetical protein